MCKHWIEGFEICVLTLDGNCDVDCDYYEEAEEDEE